MSYEAPKSQSVAALGGARALHTRLSIFGRGESSNPFETRISMRGLYAIVDVTTLSRRHLSVLDVVDAIARAKPAALQLRAKDLAPRETLHLLRAIHPVCRESGVPLFANDRPDLAMLAGCEGVHVGQGDLPVHIVRRIAPMLRIGVSTHTFSEVERAIVEQ